MLKSNKFLMLGLAIFLLGAGFFLLSTAIYAPNKAKAATSTYSQNYTVPVWRELFIIGSGQRLTLGPAQWKVRGSIEGTLFCENWVTTDYTYWVNGENLPNDGDGYNIAFRYQNSTTRSGDDSIRAQLVGENVSHDITRSGLYGAIGVKRRTSTNGETDFTAFSSYPIKWDITGKVDTSGTPSCPDFI